MALIPFEINLAGYVGQIVYYISLVLFSLIGVGILFVVYHLTSFPIKAMVFPLTGSTKDGYFSPGNPKTNRVKWIKARTAWRKMWPLFNRQEIQPFDSEFIYGKRIYAFELNGELIPARLNLNMTENTFRAELGAVPHSIRNWQSLAHKKNAQDFAQHTWWEDNKYFIMTIVTVAICAVIVLGSIYLTYKWVAPGKADWNMLTNAISNLGTQPIGPH